MAVFCYAKGIGGVCILSCMLLLKRITTSLTVLGFSYRAQLFGPESKIDVKKGSRWVAVRLNDAPACCIGALVSAQSEGSPLKQKG